MRSWCYTFIATHITAQYHTSLSTLQFAANFIIAIVALIGMQLYLLRCHVHSSLLPTSSGSIDCYCYLHASSRRTSTGALTIVHVVYMMYRCDIIISIIVNVIITCDIIFLLQHAAIATT